MAMKINKPTSPIAKYAMYCALRPLNSIGLLIFFAILYITGVNMFVCLALIIALGIGLFMTVYRLSDKYGEYGLLKKMAKRSLPVFLKVSSRKVFLSL